MAMHWYVVHTYSGYEQKAKKALEERIRQHSVEHLFEEVLVPQENVVGEAMMIYWSWPEEKPRGNLLPDLASIRWDRIGTYVR